MREQPTSNNSRSLSEKNVTNVIKNMLCWNTNTNRWNQTYPPNDSKKHATKGPIHTNHTQWCLQEKQIGTTNNPNSENSLRPFKVTIQKMGTKQWYTQNCLKKPKPSRQKQQRQRQQQCIHQQHAAMITQQIKSETMQLTTQEKTIAKIIQKQLFKQFGFCANTNFSTHHNSTNALSEMPTWYYF